MQCCLIPAKIKLIRTCIVNFFQNIILLIEINSVIYFNNDLIVKLNEKNEIFVKFRAINLVFIINVNTKLAIFLIFRLLSYFSYL